MFQVQKESKDHIIHGSFRGLDYICIQDAKDLKTRAAIEAKKEELKEKEVFVVEGYRDNELKDKEVIRIIDGMRMDNHLLSLCHDVRMLIIGDGCNTELMQGLVFDSMPNLERIEIGKNCFSKVTSFHVQHCPKLRRVFIGDGSFTKCMDCVIEDNAKLLELQLGGNDGVSISKPSDKNEKTPKDKCSIENNSATKDSTENNSATKNSTEDTGEALSLDSPDKKGSSEPKLKLASCFSSVESNE